MKTDKILEETMSGYQHRGKVNKLLNEFTLKRKGGDITMARKKVTHFMRGRIKKNTVSLQEFDSVLYINKKELIAEVESNCTYYQISRETLKMGLIPSVVPEFRGITIGGAISGLGVESSSFKYGLVHENIPEFDVLTGDGKIVTCTKTKNSDLYYTFPNSLGSLGYITKCKLKLIETLPYVKTTIIKYNNPEEFLRTLVSKSEKKSSDFLDAVIFSINNLCIIEGFFINSIPKKMTPFNRYKTIYYKELEKSTNRIIYFHTWDYLWRWDTDAFWGIEYSPFLAKFLTNTLLRQTLLKSILRTDTLLRIKKIYDKVIKPLCQLGLVARYEDLIQDVALTEEKFNDFFKWFNNTICVYPLWVCPVNNSRNKDRYPLYPLKDKLIIDLGFYSRKILNKEMNNNYYNVLFDEKLKSLNCMKGLYSKNTFTEKDFWKLYKRSKYLKVKSKYDKNNIYPDLYSKAMN